MHSMRNASSRCVGNASSLCVGKPTCVRRLFVSTFLNAHLCVSLTLMRRPGGMQQRFRAMRPLVDMLLEG